MIYLRYCITILLITLPHGLSFGIPFKHEVPLLRRATELKDEFLELETEETVDASQLSDPEYLFNQFQDTKHCDLERFYDFIVVGAGTAGCVMANRLSEDPNIKVLLIEAGNSETRAMDTPGLAGAFQDTDGIRDKITLPEPFDPMDIDWGYFTEPSKDFGHGLIDNSLLYPRGKVMGGCSTINFMIYTRGNPEDYNRWGKGWTFDDCHKYFLKAENYSVNDPKNDGYFGKTGPMYIETSSYRSEFSSAILESTKALGYKEININGPEQIGVTRLQRTIKNGYRFSANSAYLVSINRRRPNLHLRKNSHVTKILFDETGSTPRAEGVAFFHELDGHHKVYAQREVIVCAGAINSPQLLMLSGIGPKEHLEEHRIPIIKDLPVGENLQDHIYTGGLQFLINKPVFPMADFGLYATERSGPLSLPALIETYGFSQPIDKIQSIEQLYITAAMQTKSAQNMNMKPGLFEAVYQPFSAHPAYLVFSLLQKPKSRGYIHLRSCDPFVKPKIYPEYFSDPSDVEIMLNGIKEAIEISQQAPLQEWGARILHVPLPICAHHCFGSDDYWRCQIKALVSTLFHYCGTCKMGSKSDPTAVVDRHLRVIGVDGLRVVDASIMPEIIAGHLNVPIMMIAEKAADDIKKTWI